jgi:acetyl esterase/lipase
VPRRPLLALLTALVLALAAAPASAAVPTGPAGDAFYTPPKKLPGKTHGDAIWVRKLTNDQTLSQAKTNLLVLYRSTSVSGKAIAVSGTIHLPKGKAPKGGWPVVSWAHATTGIGDQCAPSRNPGPNSSVYPYHVYIEGLLDRWLAAGFAIVRTDYEGLGTKGAHPYLVGVSEARGTLDIVRAARQYSSRVGSRVAVAGHSQGGHATVFAASIARAWTPELSLRGAVAFAPFAQGDEILANDQYADTAGPRTGYFAAFMRGFDAAYPKLKVPSLLSDIGRDLYPLTLSLCVAEATSPDTEFAKYSPRQLLSAGTVPKDVLAASRANDPSDLRIVAPLLVEQGNADTTVVAGLTTIMVEDIAERGGKVTYKLHEDVNHTTVAFGRPQDEAFAWVVKRLK